MTQLQLDCAVAEATGESLRTIHRLGFSLMPDHPTDPEPLSLVIDCPHCGRPAPYPGQHRDGSSAPAQCPGCAARFGFDLREVYVTAEVRARAGRTPPRPASR